MRTSCFALIGVLVLLSGCATRGSIEADPYEGWNRGVYKFNKGIDKAVLKPVARGYQAITPDPVETGISNFFSNLFEPLTVLNDLLQGKFGQAGQDSARFLINSTIGLAGFFDPASRMDLPKHDEDLGQTLGTWGVGSGPYLMLPFLGPATVRDGLARFVETYPYSPIYDVDHVPTRNVIYGFFVIDLRARLLPLEEQLENAIDEYAFIRDAYLQRREFLIYDGNPPLEDDECEFEDDCEEF